MRSISEASGFRDRLPTNAWAVFLTMHAGAARSGGTFIESIQELAGATGTSNGILLRILRELTDHGLIDHRHLGAGRVAVTPR